MSDLPEKKERPNIEGMFTLKVDYLAPHVNAEILRQKFEPFGTVGDVYIPRSLRGGDEHRGFAFVRFLTREDADAAMSGLDGSELEGKEIKVQEAKEKKTERADYRNTSGRRFGGGDRDRNFNRRDYGDRDRRRNSRDRRDYDRRDRDSNRRDRDYGRDRDRGDRRDRGGDRDYGKDRDYGRDRERDRDDRGSRRDRSRSRSRSRDRRERSRS